MTALDYVTGIQVEKRKVRMYACRFDKERQEYYFKSAVKLAMAGSPTTYALTRDGKKGKFRVVEVLRDVTDMFEPQPGLHYQWLIAELDPRKIEAHLMNIDNDIKMYNEIRMIGERKDIKAYARKAEPMVYTGKRRRLT